MKNTSISAAVVTLARENILVKPYLRQDLDDAFAMAQKQGAGEALLFHPEKKLITEGSRSNIFWVDHGGALHWCDDALRGITQKTVLELAEQMGMRVVCDAGLDPNTLSEVAEIFITKTSTGITPVTEIRMIAEPDAPPLWQSHHGPVTARLIKAFLELTQHHAKAQS
jgi:branched-chain amino acid aminotransferase